MKTMESTLALAKSKLALTAVYLLVAMQLCVPARATAPGCGNSSPPTNPTCPQAGSNPINVRSGNVARTITDLKVWGSVGDIPFEFKRYGMSRLNSGLKWFGDGHIWRHNYQWELTTSGSNVRVIYYPDGEVQRFTYSGGAWVGIASCPDLLTQSGSDYTLTQADGSRYHFRQFTNASGAAYFQMLDITDASGNVTTLTYDSSGRLSRITEPAGRWLELTYVDKAIQDQFKSIGTVHNPIGGQWNEITVSDTTPYRYLRYYVGGDGTTNSWCNIAEMEFYDENGVKLTGTPFGTDPSWGNNPATRYMAASDGNTSTFFDYAYMHFGFTGIDLGSGNAHRISKVRYYPRDRYAGRMTNAVFEGSNAAPAVETVISKVTSSDGREVDYFYDTMPDTVLSQNWIVLNTVQYDDGTNATYNYVLQWPGQRPLLAEANDPRYDAPAVHMKYQYYMDSWVYGAVLNEINGATNQIVATLQGTTNDVSSTTNQVVYPNGKVDTCSYSVAGLIGRKDSFGNVTQYTFSASNQGFLTSITDALGHTTSFTRSARGNPLTITHSDGSTESWTRDSLDLPLSHTNELGRVTTATRDAKHRITRVDYPDSSYETFTYNSFGQVLTHRLRGGGSESSVYDARGLKTSYTDPLGNVTNYTYDASDRLASVTDPLGHTTSYLYNSRGLITKITYTDGSFISYTYDTYGNRVSTTNELGKTWTESYDEFRRVVLATDPLNRATIYSYALPGGGCGCLHSENRPTSITLPSGKVTKIAYDVEWRKTSEVVGYGTSDAATTNWTYDAVNNLVSMTDPRGKVWNYAYNTRDQRRSVTDPLGNKTQWTFDAVGNKLTETRADSSVLSWTYDTMNRPVTETNAKNETTTYSYHSDGSLASLTDARGNAYTFDVDALSRRVKMTYPGGSYEQWTYDTVGNMAQYRARNGATRNYTFDTRNRETACDWSDSTLDVSKSYDAAGRLTSLTNANCTLTYSYDAANQLLAESYAFGGAIGTKTVGYSYDADGNRLTLTYPDGSQVAYAYTGRNQVASISAGGPPPLATFTYDIAGNRLTKALENGVTASYVYDDAGRLTGLTHAKSGTTLASLSYSYNSINLRISGETGDTYTYDAADQLATVSYAVGGSGSYTYDSAGNRTSVTLGGSTSSYTANALNQYTALSGASAPTYDDNGNLANGVGASFTHDSDNRLLAGVKGADVATFARDARNRIVTRTINGGTTFGIYDEWNLLAEYDASGALVAKYIHGPKMDEMLAKIDTTGTVYYHENALGSTVALTNASGSIVERYTYDVYGLPTIEDASGVTIASTAYGNRFLFTGREWIKELGIYDYRNRAYSPDLGRFLETDPIRFTAQDINLYRYVTNDPVELLDPSGLIVFPCDFIGPLLPTDRHSCDPVDPGSNNNNNNKPYKPHPCGHSHGQGHGACPETPNPGNPGGDNTGPGTGTTYFAGLQATLATPFGGYTVGAGIYVNPTTGENGGYGVSGPAQGVELSGGVNGGFTNGNAANFSGPYVNLNGGADVGGVSLHYDTGRNLQGGSVSVGAGGGISQTSTNTTLGAPSSNHQVTPTQGAYGGYYGGF
jgi:RHS repeat-associated protein